MAKEFEQLKTDLPKQVANAAPVQKTADPISPKDEMAAMREEMAVMRAQLTAALSMIPQKTLPEADKTGLIQEVLDESPPMPGTKRRKYKVSLKHCHAAILSVDLVPGTEHMVRDTLVQKYNKHFNIIKTEHSHEVMDVTDPV